MTAKRKAPGETKTESPPKETPSKPPAVGGLAELQAKADEDAARGFKGPAKEN